MADLYVYKVLLGWKWRTLPKNEFVIFVIAVLINKKEEFQEVVGRKLGRFISELAFDDGFACEVETTFVPMSLSELSNDEVSQCKELKEGEGKILRQELNYPELAEAFDRNPAEFLQA